MIKEGLSVIILEYRQYNNLITLNINFLGKREIPRCAQGLSSGYTYLSSKFVGFPRSFKLDGQAGILQLAASFHPGRRQTTSN